MEKQLSFLVSNVDLERKFKSDKRLIKIIIYPNLTNINEIIDLLPMNTCACFILLKTSQNSGHWTCLCRNGYDIYYFDSYGIGPDGELSRIAPNIRYVLHENVKSLSRLIHTMPNGFTLSYNKIQFQTYSPQINTCGKWCFVFCKSVINGLTLAEFQDKMKTLKKQYSESYDNLVCQLWNSF